MSDLLVGLLSALISTNPTANVSNVVKQETGVAVEFVNPNDPADKAYQQVVADDDAAAVDIEKWKTSAGTTNSGAGDPKITLNFRIRERLDVIRKEYEDFLQHHPDHARGLLAYGSFLNETGDEEAAVVQWEKARQLQPKNPATWNNLANFYGHRGPVKKAFEYYSKAIELDPNQSVYYHNLAVSVYMFRKDAEEYYKLSEHDVFDKALEFYRKAMKLAPNDFILASDYAECFYGTNPPRLKEGLAAWLEVLKIAHDDDERQGVLIHIARIEWKLGLFDEATEQLNAVTNANYEILKQRILRNIKQSREEKGTNAPPKL